MSDIAIELHQRINALERQVSGLSRRAKAHGWQLPCSFDMHRFGGGKLIFGFDGQSKNMVGRASNDWTENNITFANYRAATYGGPNITLDGAAEYLSHADEPGTETGAEEFLVWSWCYPTSLATSDRCIAAKYRAAGDNRSWMLYYQLAATEFEFLCSPAGLGGAGRILVTSTYGAVAIDNWYFVAAYFEASSLMRIYVGHNDDTALTIDSLAVGVPATLFDGNAPLTIGADGAPSRYWEGNIGKVLGRANVPSTDIDNHVNMLFQSTRTFYAE